MFERFTIEARAVVVQAQERALAARSSHLETIHLLLGVAGTESAAAQVLAEAGAGAETLAAAVERLDDAHLLGTLGIDVEQVRDSIERSFGPGAWDGSDPGTRAGRGRRIGGAIPFAPDAKKALELSLREAIALKCKSIEAAHILMGLLRTGGRPVEALQAAGVDPTALRRTLVERLRRAS